MEQKQLQNKEENCCPQFPKRPVSCIKRFLRSSKHLRLFTMKLFKPRAHGRFWKFPAASAAFECCNVVKDHQSHLISRHPGSRCGAASGSPEPSQGHLWDPIPSLHKSASILLIWLKSELREIVLVSLLLQLRHLELVISFQSLAFLLSD